MNIGRAAAASRLPPKTIRYYESIGLVIPKRRGNGYRYYDEGHIHKLRFIQRARSLGFTVDECRNLLSLYEDKNRTSSEVKRIAQTRLADIDRKTDELSGMHLALSRLIDSCRGDDRPDCPILDDLATTIEETRPI